MAYIVAMFPPASICIIGMLGDKRNEPWMGQCFSLVLLLVLREASQ